jgi:hypothetical protein
MAQQEQQRDKQANRLGRMTRKKSEIDDRQNA